MSDSFNIWQYNIQCNFCRVFGSIKGVYLHAISYYSAEHQKIKISYEINVDHNCRAGLPAGNFLWCLHSSPLVSVDVDDDDGITGTTYIHTTYNITVVAVFQIVFARLHC